MARTARPTLTSRLADAEARIAALTAELAARSAPAPSAHPVTAFVAQPKLGVRPIRTGTL